MKENEHAILLEGDAVVRALKNLYFRIPLLGIGFYGNTNTLYLGTGGDVELLYLFSGTGFNPYAVGYFGLQSFGTYTSFYFGIGGGAEATMRGSKNKPFVEFLISILSLENETITSFRLKGGIRIR